MKNRALWVWTTCVAMLATGPVLASGFSIYEQSAKASGQAGAWVARADDAAAAWYNPAAMTRSNGMQVQFGINLITIGSDSKFTIDDPAWETLGALAGSPVANGTRFDAVQNNETPIQLYFTQKVNDRVAWGIGINNPIGLVTEWNNRPITLSHRRAELVTFVVNPSVAYKVNDNWSLAFGIDYMYADVKEFSRDVAVDTDENPANGLEVVGMADLTGDGDAWGWNVAAHYASDDWSFGFTYRGEMEPDIDGTLDYSGFEALGPFAPADTKGTTTLGLPAQAAVGAAWNVADGWELEFDVSWAGWSNFEALDIKVEEGDDIYLQESWDDTFAFRLGAAYDLSERHQIRFGALFDQSPVPTETLRPSIPDSDRKAVTIGYGFTGKSWNIDAYYMPLFFDEMTAHGDPAGKPLATPTPDGVIDGKYETFVHLLGVTFNKRF